MAVINRSLRIDSSSNFQIINITNDIVNALNENEKGLLNDFEKVLKDIVKENDNYQHDRIDNNAASHLRAFLLGPSETIPIIDGRLDLGTWQSVFFIELDGPRRGRTIDLTFIGE